MVSSPSIHILLILAIIAGTYSCSVPATPILEKTRSVSIDESELIITRKPMSIKSFQDSLVLTVINSEQLVAYSVRSGAIVNSLHYSELNHEKWFDRAWEVKKEIVPADADIFSFEKTIRVAKIDATPVSLINEYFFIDNRNRRVYLISEFPTPYTSADTTGQYDGYRLLYWNKQYLLSELDFELNVIDQKPLQYRITSLKASREHFPHSGFALMDDQVISPVLDPEQRQELAPRKSLPFLSLFKQSIDGWKETKQLSEVLLDSSYFRFVDYFTPAHLYFLQIDDQLILSAGKSIYNLNSQEKIFELPASLRTEEDIYRFDSRGVSPNGLLCSLHAKPGTKKSQASWWFKFYSFDDDAGLTAASELSLNALDGKVDLNGSKVIYLRKDTEYYYIDTYTVN